MHGVWFGGRTGADGKFWVSQCHQSGGKTVARSHTEEVGVCFPGGTRGSAALLARWLHYLDNQHSCSCMFPLSPRRQFIENITFFSFVLLNVTALHDKCDSSLEQTADSLPVRLWKLFHRWLCMFPALYFLPHPLIKPPGPPCLPHLSAVCPNNLPVLKPTWANWIWGGTLFGRDLNRAAAPVVKP